MLPCLLENCPETQLLNCMRNQVMWETCPDLNLISLTWETWHVCINLTCMSNQFSQMYVMWLKHYLTCPVTEETCINLQLLASTATVETVLWCKSDDVCNVTEEIWENDQFSCMSNQATSYTGYQFWLLELQLTIAVHLLGLYRFKEWTSQHKWPV
jgi:hypothetical protein